MRASSLRSLCAVGAGAAVLAVTFLVAARTTRAQDTVTAEPERYEIAPAFAAGEQFRVERSYRQTTITAGVGGRVRMRGDVAGSLYDAATEIQALVTVEKVNDKGAATVWTAKFERLRLDIPDPIQTKEYRMRVRERKQKRLEPNAHPLEGATLRVETKGDKAKLSKILKSGDDAGISERYPEVTPIMQSLVDPDWAAEGKITVGTEWEMKADQIFRMTEVLQKTPLSGKIRCKLVSVEDGIANIDWSTELSETYATAKMELDIEGRIEFDVKGRHTIGNRYKGEVKISAKGSSLAGTGTISGGATYTDPTAKDETSEADKDK